MAYQKIINFSLHQDIKSAGLEIVGQIHAFPSGHIHKVGHCVASDVLVFAVLQQNLLSINPPILSGINVIGVFLGTGHFPTN